MKLPNFISAKLQDLLRNKRGATAVEFALILPIMVAIYLSTVEISMAIAAQRRVAIAAGTMGDLAAQYETMNDDNINVILGSSFAVLIPYTTMQMYVSVTSVVIDDGGAATVDWSYRQTRHGGTNDEPAPDSDFPHGAPYSLPADLNTPETSVIVAKMDYTYISPVGALLNGERHLEQTTYFRPRMGTKIPFMSSGRSSDWALPTGGPDGTQIDRDYVGYGPDYGLATRAVTRTDNGHASEDSAPPELENAWRCDMELPECDDNAPGNEGTGELGNYCFSENYQGEIYMAPVCYTASRWRRIH